MRAEAMIELPISARLAVDAVETIHGRELAALAAAATSKGEALLERSGLVRLDEANQCHFGAQLGRPVYCDGTAAIQLRWWNDRSRSLTPGFIGELHVIDSGASRSELRLGGEYHPRAFLYELVDRRLLNGMARAVVSDFLERLAGTVKATLSISAA